MLAGSDASAVIEVTRDVVYLDDGDCAVLTAEGYRTYHLEGHEVQRGVHEVTWALDSIEKSGYPHFMLKEIYEQPSSVADVMRGRILRGSSDARLGGILEHESELAQVERIVITACGTSWHAGLVGEYMLEELAEIPVSVEYASEFRYRNPVLEAGTLTLAISQSGETADTLAALTEARQQGSTTMGVVNAVGSTISRQTDFGIYLHARVRDRCGFDQSLHKSARGAFAFHNVPGSPPRYVRGEGTLLEIGQHLQMLPDQIQEVLKLDEEIRELARDYKDAQNFLYLGRGYQFPVALEGALKLKEVSYIHAEGYPAAEMKHGPIALIDEDMPVVVLAPRDPIYSKVVSNIEEVKARSGKILAIVSDDAPELQGKVDHMIQVPHTLPHPPASPHHDSFAAISLPHCGNARRGRGPATESG